MWHHVAIGSDISPPHGVDSVQWYVFSRDWFFEVSESQTPRLFGSVHWNPRLMAQHFQLLQEEADLASVRLLERYRPIRVQTQLLVHDLRFF